MEIPKRMRNRPVWQGFPIPFNVQIGPDGTPDFRVTDEETNLRILKYRLCAMCGQKQDAVVAFIGGEKSVASRLFADPPMHKDCAKFAAATCPYLSSADRQMSKLVQKPTHQVRDLVDEKPPKHMAIYYTKKYEYGQVKGHTGVYIKADPPTSVDWNVMPGGPPPIVEIPEPPVIKEETFSDLIDNLKEGHGFMYLEKHPETHNFLVQKIDTRDLEERNAPRWFNIVCPLMRLDMWEKYSQHLEYKFFPPDTEINNEFNLIFFKFEDMMWGVISVPIERRRWCEIAADECQCRLADGTAKILGGGLINEVGAASLLPMDMAFAIPDIKGAAFPLVSDHTYGLEPQYETRGPKLVIMSQQKP